MEPTVIHHDDNNDDELDGLTRLNLTNGNWPIKSRKHRTLWREPITIPLWTVFIPTGVLFLVIALISGLHHIRITNLELRMRTMEGRLNRDETPLIVGGSVSFDPDVSSSDKCHSLARNWLEFIIYERRAGRELFEIV
ncbi:hypothetical protein KIN20_005948 [Parelaphostrongylus tenuis]|uniref:Transmembrane protein n=1 Tax=Parelaphostrongylus tenuis TaxID=148309 RepID=A0AAD5M2W9_PARTN|nr:hypothetical protein KIN20_005948 [Parelaphostrongylus tenuis]